MHFRVAHSLFDVLLAHVARGLNRDVLLLAGALVLGRDVDDAVGVDVEGDFNLRHAARRRCNPVQDEAAQRGVVGGHIALALQNVDFHRGLPVCGGRINLALLHGDGRVAVDDLVEHAAERLDAQRQRRDVQQQQSP